jgi:hypothetical protein
MFTDWQRFADHQLRNSAMRNVYCIGLHTRDSETTLYHGNKSSAGATQKPGL